MRSVQGEGGGGAVSRTVTRNDHSQDDADHEMDAGTCDTNNQRVSFALEALKTRPMTLCMQVARAPNPTEMTSNRYTAFMMDSERKESKTVIAIRKGLAKQAIIKVLELKRWVNRTEISTDGATVHINKVYLPHRTSREWSEECLQALTPVKSVLCGDMNHTPSEDMVVTVWGVDTSRLSDTFKDKWNKTPSHRHWQVAQYWAPTMTTTKPRSDDEWTTRKDWECSTPSMTDYVLSSGIDMSRHITFFI